MYVCRELFDSALLKKMTLNVLNNNLYTLFFVLPVKIVFIQSKTITGNQHPYQFDLKITQVTFERVKIKEINKHIRKSSTPSESRIRVRVYNHSRLNCCLKILFKNLYILYT